MKKLIVTILMLTSFSIYAVPACPPEVTIQPGAEAGDECSYKSTYTNCEPITGEVEIIQWQGQDISCCRVGPSTSARFCDAEAVGEIGAFIPLSFESHDDDSIGDVKDEPTEMPRRR